MPVINLTIRRVVSTVALFALAFGAVSALAAQTPTARPALSESVRQFVAVEAPVVALTNVRVVDGTGAAPADDQTIILRDGRIAELGPSASVRVPEGARVLELRGHTVIPGLVGMHNHTFYTTSARQAQISITAPRLYLASGVTTIRTTGSYHPYSEVNLKRAIETGAAVGPRMHITGPYITGPSGGYMTGVATAEDARRVVGYWADEGATWFKAYTTISREALKAAIDEAHRRGLKFTGHLCSVSFREAVALGIDNLEHGLFTNSDYDAAKEADRCPSNLRRSLLEVSLDGPDVQATFREMIDRGVAMTSTLAVYELSVPGRPPLEQRVLDALAPEVLAEYLATRQAIARNAATSTTAEVFRKAQAFERAFVRAGGLLAAGVDPTGNGGALPGYGDQRNYELLIEAGFSPVEAVRIMTLNGAKVLGVDRELGTVERGKLADLVVIRGDPVLTPAEIRGVTLVFKDGIGFDSAKLIESVRGQVGVR
ncbi:MAG TPA: amidohydrolase family protein [Gemmatimonadaceae bacterium]|nr:amidohydrolase family protein [Gemmatimonadaceae bacterium]